MHTSVEVVDILDIINSAKLLAFLLIITKIIWRIVIATKTAY